MGSMPRQISHASNAPLAGVRGLVFGIGAQKAGTTWLAQVLAAHPAVHMPRKELHYWDVIRYPYTGWDQMGGAMATDPLDHGAYLAALTEGRGRAELVAEMTPSYALCTAATFAEMAALHPDVRFVLVMRDPVGRLVAGLRHKMRLAGLAPRAEVLARLMDEALDNPADPDFLRSRYDLTLARLDKAGARVLPMFYETLFTPAAMARLGPFLGLADVQADFARRVNPGAAPLPVDPARLAAARRVLSPAYDDAARRFGSDLPEGWA